MSNYPLRLPTHLMETAKSMAARSGTSLNQFLATLISEKLGEMRALEAVQARIARADLAAGRAVLDRVPDRPPLAGDEVAPN